MARLFLHEVRGLEELGTRRASGCTSFRLVLSQRMRDKLEERILIKKLIGLI